MEDQDIDFPVGFDGFCIPCSWSSWEPVPPYDPVEGLIGYTGTGDACAAGSICVPCGDQEGKHVIIKTHSN